MSLSQLQRAAVELCYGDEPSAEACAALGDERIWRIYRDAVRKRLRGELEVALPRTRVALGDPAFYALFDRFLRHAPPRTRFFHAVVDSFAQAAGAWLRDDAALPPYAADLCAYEAARWKVGDASDDPGVALVEFEFERIPVLSPAVVLLDLQHAVQQHAVQQPADADGGYAQRATQLCVYRGRDAIKASYFTLNAVTLALMQRFVLQQETVSQSVQRVAAEREVALDQAFVDGLCTVLADFMERGILLGSRAAG